jgi:hypothetical protein
MRNVNTDPDPLARVHDDDLRQIINNLDRVRIGLADMQASPELDNAPELQGELGSYARVVRAAADLLFHFRKESHQ